MVMAMAMAILRLVVMIEPFQREGLKSNNLFLFIFLLLIYAQMQLIYLIRVSFIRKATGDDLNDSDEESKRSKMVTVLFLFSCIEP